MKSAKTAYLIVICTGVVFCWMGNIFHQKGQTTGDVDFYKWFTLGSLAISFLYSMSFGFLYAGKIGYALKTGGLKTLFTGAMITAEYFALTRIEDYNMFIGLSTLGILVAWNLSEFYFLYKATRIKK